VEGESPGAEAEPRTSAAGDDDAAHYPKGLTGDGRAKFKELCDANQERFVRQLSHELTRHWESLEIDGPEAHTWDRVLAAEAARQERERLKIDDEVRRGLRAELAEELQALTDRNRELEDTVWELQGILAELQPDTAPDPAPPSHERSRTSLRRLGHALIGGATAMLAAQAIPTIETWETVVAVTATAIGTFLVPPRDGDR
jgi:hypothetical protein